MLVSSIFRPFFAMVAALSFASALSLRHVFAEDGLYCGSAVPEQTELSCNEPLAICEGPNLEKLKKADREADRVFVEYNQVSLKFLNLVNRVQCREQDYPKNPLGIWWQHNKERVGNNARYRTKDATRWVSKTLPELKKLLAEDWPESDLAAQVRVIAQVRDVLDKVKQRLSEAEKEWEFYEKYALDQKSRDQVVQCVQDSGPGTLTAEIQSFIQNNATVLNAIPPDPEVLRPVQLKVADQSPSTSKPQTEKAPPDSKKNGKKGGQKAGLASGANSSSKSSAPISPERFMLSMSMEARGDAPFDPNDKTPGSDVGDAQSGTTERSEQSAAQDLKLQKKFKKELERSFSQEIERALNAEREAIELERTKEDGIVVSDPRSPEDFRRAEKEVLDQFEKTGQFKADLGGLILESEYVFPRDNVKQPITIDDYKLYRRRWEAKKKEWKKIQDQGGFEALRKTMFQDFVSSYTRDNARISDFLAGRGANCSAETKLFLATVTELQTQLPEGQVIGFQKLKQHVLPVVYDKKKGTVRDLVGGTTLNFVAAPIYHPAALVYTSNHSGQGGLEGASGKYIVAERSPEGFALLEAIRKRAGGESGPGLKTNDNFNFGGQEEISPDDLRSGPFADGAEREIPERAFILYSEEEKNITAQQLLSGTELPPDSASADDAGNQAGVLRNQTGVPLPVEDRILSEDDVLPTDASYQRYKNSSFRFVGRGANTYFVFKDPKIKEQFKKLDNNERWQLIKTLVFRDAAQRIDELQMDEYQKLMTNPAQLKKMTPQARKEMEEKIGKLSHFGSEVQSMESDLRQASSSLNVALSGLEEKNVENMVKQAREKMSRYYMVNRVVGDQALKRPAEFLARFQGAGPTSNDLVQRMIGGALWDFTSSQNDINYAKLRFGVSSEPLKSEQVWERGRAIRDVLRAAMSNESLIQVEEPLRKGQAGFQVSSLGANQPFKREQPTIPGASQGKARYQPVQKIEAPLKTSPSAYLALVQFGIPMHELTPEERKLFRRWTPGASELKIDYLKNDPRSDDDAAALLFPYRQIGLILEGRDPQTFQFHGPDGKKLPRDLADLLAVALKTYFLKYPNARSAQVRDWITFIERGSEEGECFGSMERKRSVSRYIAEEREVFLEELANLSQNSSLSPEYRVLRTQEIKDELNHLHRQPLDVSADFKDMTMGEYLKQLEAELAGTR